MKVTIDTQAKTVEVHEGTLGELVDFLGKDYEVISKKEILLQPDHEYPDPFRGNYPINPWYTSPYKYNSPSSLFTDIFKITC